MFDFGSGDWPASGLEDFFSHIPEAQDFMRNYYPWAWEQMTREPEAYPGGFDIPVDPREEQLIGMQMGRIGQVPDLASAWEGAFESYLPQFRRSYEEHTRRPAEERLQAMGLAGSSPGMGMMAGLGENQAIQEASMRQDTRVNQAMAKEQMFNLEGAQMGAAFDMLGPGRQRAQSQQQMQHGDWLRQQGQPAEYAMAMGAPMAQGALGAMTGIYQSGQQGRSLMAASQMQHQNAWQMMQAEQQYMAPFLQMANRPVEIPPGNQGLLGNVDCCFIFLEARYADGTMDSVVRRYRDEAMTPRNRRGYYKLAEVLVPLMRKSGLVKLAVRALLTDPLVSYGKYHYGQGRLGRIFKPLARAWINLFDYLGGDHPFIRENGEVV